MDIWYMHMYLGKCLTIFSQLKWFESNAMKCPLGVLLLQPGLGKSIQSIFHVFQVQGVQGSLGKFHHEKFMKILWIWRNPPRNPTKTLKTHGFIWFFPWKVWEGASKTLDFPRFQNAFAARVVEIMPGNLVNSWEIHNFFINFPKIYEKFMKYLWIWRNLPRNPLKKLWKVWRGTGKTLGSFGFTINGSSCGECGGGVSRI